MGILRHRVIFSVAIGYAAFFFSPHAYAQQENPHFAWLKENTGRSHRTLYVPNRLNSLSQHKYHYLPIFLEEGIILADPPDGKVLVRWQQIRLLAKTKMNRIVIKWENDGRDSLPSREWEGMQYLTPAKGIDVNLYLSCFRKLMATKDNDTFEFFEGEYHDEDEDSYEEVLERWEQTKNDNEK